MRQNSIQSHPQKRARRRLAAAVSATLLSGLFACAPVAFALPVQATNGVPSNVTIAESGGTMDITGAAANNVIKWKDFSIAQGETVNFTNANNYLNYVTGANRSEILGALTGGGNVYLINPHGVLFGATAQVNVGSLYVSTKPLSNDDLAAFAANGTSPLANAAVDGGDIVNQGAALSAMNIVMEADGITFTKSALENVTATGTAQITANDVAFGSDTGAAATNPFTGTAPTWYKMVTDGTEITANLAGNSMLGNNITVNDTLGALTGKLHGAGYTATLNLAATTDDDPAFDDKNMGLFGTINGGTVRNLTLGGSITKTGGYLGNNPVGALAGAATNATITNVTNKATITAPIYDYIGGIVGTASGTTFTNVTNNGAITGDPSKPRSTTSASCTA